MLNSKAPLEESSLPTPPRKIGKLALSVIGVLVAVCAVGFAIIAVFADGNPETSPEILTYTIGPHAVVVNYDVAKPRDKRISCTVVAENEEHSVIGATKVIAPKGQTDPTGKVTVTTPSQAVAADINCAGADGDADGDMP
jgi:hypothetical protein